MVVLYEDVYLERKSDTCYKVTSHTLIKIISEYTLLLISFVMLVVMLLLIKVFCFIYVYIYIYIFSSKDVVK
jgi:hypothetical protein